MLQAVMPGDVGRELATLKLNATRLLNAPQPDLMLLRSTFQNLLTKMPLYRRIESVSPLVRSAVRPWPYLLAAAVLLLALEWSLYQRRWLS